MIFGFFMDSSGNSGQRHRPGNREIVTLMANSVWLEAQASKTFQNKITHRCDLYLLSGIMVSGTDLEVEISSHDYIRYKLGTTARLTIDASDFGRRIMDQVLCRPFAFLVAIL